LVMEALPDCGSILSNGCSLIKCFMNKQAHCRRPSVSAGWTLHVTEGISEHLEGGHQGEVRGMWITALRQ
jgi:hypothetical protein